MGDRIRFEAAVQRIGDRSIVRLPEDASARLPSRGQVAVTGTVNGHDFSTVVEPDGMRGHWISVGHHVQLVEGDSAVFDFASTKLWPETVVPDDLRAALDQAGDLGPTWQGLTPMARWEWVRWIGSTKNPATRARRVDVAISKLHDGKRRPCCFDLASCTDPELARSGKLITG